ncbi:MULTISPECIES: helix-turn-helix domain-containing protein [unclassified Rhodococcus (in: high G+C Gram-positive bacteria)]|uniref:helix-turn-helix domain-containing protein n=1 Tax=unclassified Rhodococcus (in: high G+C Gram-positive bacteria) TaxID=192944 RepID=UPI00096A530C|nr:MULTISPECIES: helix-turn-helix domain-containing protein [unclassified Rhodococcus (in: high G+C Gram-positive bacteria)]
MTDADAQPASTTERPRWSASEAARRCGVGRATIQRALDAGRLPGAVRTDKGWQIPLEALLAAGYTPDRPSAPDQPTPPQASPAREHHRAAPAPDLEHAQRVAELEALLATERARADLEHARRMAAEALAAERAERVADLRHALRMIESAPPEHPTEQPASTAPDPVTPDHSPIRRRSGLLGWVLGD